MTGIKATKEDASHRSGPIIFKKKNEKRKGRDLKEVMHLAIIKDNSYVPKI